MMSAEMRCGVGNGSGGGLNWGWNPPTVTMKLALSPQANSRPISPSMVTNKMCESYSEAKKYIRCLSNSSAPAKFT